VLDAFNIRVHEMYDKNISMCMIDLKYRILEVVTTDQHYVQVKERL
jgi:hypothetical protein